MSAATVLAVLLFAVGAVLALVAAFAPPSRPAIGWLALAFTAAGLAVQAAS